MPYPELSDYCIKDVTGILSPGVLIFKHLLEHNIDEMVRIAGRPEQLRPHCKTHKCREIVRMFLERGVLNHKCATIAEAEMLAGAGATNVMIAYQMVGPNLDRLGRLMHQFPTVEFSVLVDCPAGVSLLSNLVTEVSPDRSIGVFLDLNSGMQRTGIAPGQRAIELYEMIAAGDGVRPSGLHWYDGHHRQPDLSERRTAVEVGWQGLTHFRDQLLLSGLEVPNVVAAGTGSFPILAELGEPNLQLSPGTTTFHDDDMATRFPELNFFPAQAILTRVISRPQHGSLTLDVGHKACAADQPFGQRLSFPQLSSFNEVIHSEEHLVIETPDANQFRIGDHLIAFSRHACPVSAVHQFATVIEDGNVFDRWEMVARDRMITI
ncbi:MAG: D-TA family PLP-dependent enzyme [Planctomycetota bacterium]